MQPTALNAAADRSPEGKEAAKNSQDRTMIEIPYLLSAPEVEGQWSFSPDGGAASVSIACGAVPNSDFSRGQVLVNRRC